MVHNLIWEVREGAPEEMASMLNFEECVRISQMNNGEMMIRMIANIRIVIAICQVVF